MPSCLICQQAVEPFMSFGLMPIANGFLRENDFADEYFFDLRVAFCETCKMVQLIEQPCRDKMFNENYAFFSGTSRDMALHFEKFAHHVMDDYLRDKDPFVVEIGCNDGIMMQHFVKAGIRHLGIEPSANVAEVAKGKGVNTTCAFFDEEQARNIVAQYGQADAFLGANVMCHVSDIHAIIRGIDILLKPDGVVIFEDPYLGDVIEKTSYDQIYDEHAFVFSVSSISNLFRMHGMEVVDVEHQETHGGSMRYVIARQGKRKVAQGNVESALIKELNMGLLTPEAYGQFRSNCELSRKALTELLAGIKHEGKRVVGYAATSKSTTILNYCGITADLIEYISDTTPIKQGKFSPGTHIPVRHHDCFTADYPDYALLFAYNHSKEIFEKEYLFEASSGKWIVYVPQVMVL